jgi:hypothetical protein
MFDGFRSRWISPAACTAPSASATPAPSTLTLSQGGPCARGEHAQETVRRHRRSPSRAVRRPGRHRQPARRGIRRPCGQPHLQTKPPPELDVISENRIDQLDRDRAPGRRPAEEHLAHPASPKTTDQNIVPDSPRVSWPKGIHATPSPQGNSGRSEPARTR